MPIKKYEIGQPDSDGDRLIDLVFEIENKTENPVMLIKFDAFHTDENGYLFQHSTGNSSSCSLAKGNSHELSDWGRTHNRYLAQSKSSDVKIQAQLFKQEIFKFGPFIIPENDGISRLDADIESKIIDSKVKITMARLPPDDEGEVNIDVMTYLKNSTDAQLEAAEFHVTLIDRKGKEIGRAESVRDIPPHAWGALEVSLWRTKQNKLKGANIEVSITTYERVGTEVLSGSAEVSH